MQILVSFLFAIMATSVVASEVCESIPECFGSNYTGVTQAKYEFLDNRSEFSCNTKAGFRIEGNLISMAPVWMDCEFLNVRDLNYNLVIKDDNNLYYVDKNGEIDLDLGVVGQIRENEILINIEKKLPASKRITFDMRSRAFTCFPKGITYDSVHQFKLELKKVENKLFIKRFTKNQKIVLPHDHRDLKDCAKIKDWYSKENVLKTEIYDVSGELIKNFP